MRKVIASSFVTLDGMIAGANGELDWFMGDDAVQAELRALHNRVDTMLLGRVTYELFVQFWPTAPSDTPGVDHMNHTPKIVFSRTLESAPWGKWENARVIHDHVAEEIAALKQQPGKDMVLYASANLVQSFANLGLIDEYQLLLHPLVFGSGKPLFAGIKPTLKLTLTRSIPLKNGVVILYYEPNQQ
jgi:dihydrofolate reductase